MTSRTPERPEARHGGPGSPAGRPLWRQTWAELLFLHWPMSAARIRHLVPATLDLDTHDGSAWVGVVPFTMWGIRPAGTPALPFLSRSHEINLRTYVTHRGVPGVWFLSLDASNPLLVWGGRQAFRLPYYLARMTLRVDGEATRLTSRRVHRNAPRADFEARWERGDSPATALPGTLEYFLVERYALYASGRRGLERARVRHRPWTLSRAHVSHLASSLFTAQGLPEPEQEPIAHALGEPIEVDVWELERVQETAEERPSTSSMP